MRVLSQRGFLVSRIRMAWWRSVLCLLASAVVGKAEDYTYSTNSGTITIARYRGSGGAVTLPSMTNGLPVTTIGDEAFVKCTGLKSVTIPGGVTRIGSSAFRGCTSLTHVTIGTNVTRIGSDAFFSCTSLAHVTIPGSVASIDRQAFYDCVSLTGIGVNTDNPAYSSVDGVLFDKSQTTLIHYPAGKAGGSYAILASVTSIGDGAFQGCTNLTHVMIGTNVISIGSRAFVNCTGLTSVTIPSRVASIGDSAFRGCASLTHVTIGTNVTRIGSDAFFSCTRLTSVTIPASVTSIGSEAFCFCGSLTAVTVDAGNPVYSSVDGVLLDKSQTTLIQYPGGAGDYTIPGRITSLGSGAFKACLRLTSVTIPGSVTSIGSEAFSACTSLIHVTIGTNVSGLGKAAFGRCTRLTGVTIPGSVTRIGDDVFMNCTSLTNVTIPGSVTSIGGGAFVNCTGLTDVTIPGSVTNIGGGAFYDCASLTNVCFKGDAPRLGDRVFDEADKATICYMPGTTGWSATFGGRPTVIWKPPTNAFSFDEAKEKALAGDVLDPAKKATLAALFADAEAEANKLAGNRDWTNEQYVASCGKLTILLMELQRETGPDVIVYVLSRTQREEPMRRMAYGCLQQYESRFVTKDIGVLAKALLLTYGDGNITTNRGPLTDSSMQACFIARIKSVLHVSNKQVADAGAPVVAGDTEKEARAWLKIVLALALALPENSDTKDIIAKALASVDQ